MALSEKQKQKKLTKKKQKRKNHVRENVSKPLQTSKAKSYAHFPIHECLIPPNLFELGIGTVLVARRTSEGDIAVSIFMVDVFCLGIKNAFFTVMSEYKYEHSMKPQIDNSNSGNQFEKIHQTCVKKLIEEAVLYAKDLGFNSHSDYKNAQGIFGDIDSSACPVKYTYGQNGKPFYIRGPNESVQDANKIVEKLNYKCGEGGFEYILMMDE